MTARLPTRAMDSDVKTPGQGNRRDRAANTRRAIRRAAAAEFGAKGYHGATLAAIAARAGVAVQTVYFVFHTKAELLSEVFDAAVTGQDARAPERTEWFRSALRQSDPATALREFIAGAHAVYERASAVSEVARVGAMSDSEVKAVFDRHERLRIDGYRRVIDAVAESAPLRDGLDRDHATDILATVLGAQTYLTLTEGRGWSHDQVVTWWLDTVPRLLLPDAPDGGGGPGATTRVPPTPAAP